MTEDSNIQNNQLTIRLPHTPRQSEHFKRSFTLIELLVVLAILGILTALLAPALRNARDKAKSIICLNNLRQLSSLITMYTNDNNGWYPSALFDNSGSYTWINVKLQALGYIPASSVDAYGHTKMVICPLTAQYSRYTIGYNSCHLFGKEAPLTQMGSINQPAQAWMWMDSETTSGNSYVVFETQWDKSLINVYGFPMFRHSAVANVAYCDGHAGFLTETEYNAKWSMEAVPSQSSFWTGK